MRSFFKNVVLAVVAVHGRRPPSSAIRLLPLADANDVDADHYRRCIPLEKADRKAFSR